MNDHLAQIEALLFTAGAPVSKKRLMQSAGRDADQLAADLVALRDSRAESGVTIVDSGTHVALATNPSLASFLERSRDSDSSVPLSKVAQETLAVIAYAGPITKTDLDFLRGVNTQYILRRLMMRGLVRERSVKRGRSFEVTVDLLLHLGARSPEELPDYDSIRQSVISGIQDTRERMEEQNA